jgi:putative addiction module killer protein
MFEILQTETFQRWRIRLKDERTRALLAARLARLSLGQMGDIKSVGDGIGELRIHHGPGYRIYFQRRGKMIVVLLCGGDKSTQRKDIAMAKQLAQEWSQ